MDALCLLSCARRRRLLVPDKGGGLRKSKTSALAPYGEEPVGQGGASWCSSAVARRLSEARARAHPSNNLGGVCKLALLGRGELLVQVLGNVLALPIGNRDLFQRGARGILHEEIGRSSLRIGDLQALDPRCRISDEVLDRRVVPEASAADVERRLRIGAATARDVFGAAARALLDQRIGGPDGLT